MDKIIWVDEKQTEVATGGFYKKVFFKILLNLQENTSAKVCFFKNRI